MIKANSRLQQHATACQTYDGPIPRDELHTIQAGNKARAKLFKTAADLRFWRNYIRSGIVAYRTAETPKRHQQITADIRAAWPNYRTALRRHLNAAQSA